MNPQWPTTNSSAPAAAHPTIDQQQQQTATNDNRKPSLVCSPGLMDTTTRSQTQQGSVCSSHAAVGMEMSNNTMQLQGEMLMDSSENTPMYEHGLVEKQEHVFSSDIQRWKGVSETSD